MHTSKASGRAMTDNTKKKIFGILQKDKTSPAPPVTGTERVLDTDGATIRVLADGVTIRVIN